MPGIDTAAGEKSWLFKKGQSGNPAGRPKGSKNKATLFAETMLAGDVEAVTRMALDKAIEGDGAAQRFFLSRLLAPAKHRRIPLDLPELTGRPARDAAAAYEVVRDALAAGEIAPAEALAYADFIDRMRAAQEAAAAAQDTARPDARPRPVHPPAGWPAAPAGLWPTADRTVFSDRPPGAGAARPPGERAAAAPVR
jgi:Family of unknown function (DUF5681)